MPANNEQTRTCGCSTQQYAPIIVNSVEYQNGANTIYQANYVNVAAASAGTLSSPNGNPRFKSDYERMQYLLGSKNQVQGYGVARKIFALGTN